MDAAAARRQHSSVALAVLMAFAGLGLAGCENSLSLFGSNSIASQEQPAAPPPPAVAPQPALAKVAIAPVIGAPDAVGRLIHQEFSSAVEKQRVSIAANKDERVDYTLRGYIVAAKDKTATKVSYIWDVTDPTGKRVNRVTGEEVVQGGPSKDPWAAITPPVIQNITGKAASSFGSWLATHAGQAAVASAPTGQPAGVGAQVSSAQPAAPPQATQHAPPRQTAAAQPAVPAAGPTTGSIAREGPVTAIVPTVAGAPGDGSTSLAAAIRNELASKGVTVANKPTTLAYRVEGTVTVGTARDGKQPIQIEWLVRDPHGKKLGTVSQKNEIPAGSLDGAWGATANQAAGAAAQGIVKLLPQKGVN